MKIDEFVTTAQGTVAQKPSERRDVCRMMVLDRQDGTIEHKHFYDVIDYLNPGDCLVLNNSKVLPARLFGEKEGTGAKVEFLLIKRMEGDRWENHGQTGQTSETRGFRCFQRQFPGRDLGLRSGWHQVAEFHYDGIFMERLEELGKMPLPPYIERESTLEDKDMYQTVYCKEEGSVAAPTAGLHFTEELLQKAKDKGVRLAYVTLHVGIGTFRPVKCENVEDHHMHFEEYFVDEETAKTINETILAGGRIISVGTTSTRTLESAAYHDEASGKNLIRAGEGSTGIFIYPGYTFKVVDALITNFHLPKSTLLMLISALYDREKILEAYQAAVDEKYRFFSYGDAMLIQ